MWQARAGGLLRGPRHDDGAADGHAGVRRGHLHPHPRHCRVQPRPAGCRGRQVVSSTRSPLCSVCWIFVLSGTGSGS